MNKKNFMKKALIIVNLALISIPVSLPLYPATVDEYWKSFAIHEKNKQWIEGEKLLSKAIAEHPDVLYFNTSLNMCLRNQKKNAEALNQIEPLYRKHPGDKYVRESYQWSLHEMGWEHFRKNENEKSLAFFEKAYSLNRDDEWNINAYGSILRRVDPSRSIPILENGYAKYRQNNYIRDNLVESYVVLASNCLEKKDYDCADTLHRKASAVNPDHESHLLGYGMLLRVTQRYEEALHILEKGEKLHPSNRYFRENILNTYYAYAGDEGTKKNFARAIAMLDIAIKKYPDEIWLPYHMSTNYIEEKHFEKASEYILRAAANKSRKNLSAKESEDIDNSLFFRLDSILYYYRGQKKFNEGSALISRVEPHIRTKHLLYTLQSRLFVSSGRKKEGFNLAYKAYDTYIADHPEFKKTMILPFPIKGTYYVGGNNSRTEITHAGLDRFCIDFWGSNAAGELRSGADKSGHGKNEDYFGFGKPVYSPVHGTVTHVTDDSKDIDPGPVRLYNGNSITIQDDNGFHYVFVHNKYKSALVKNGQRVKPGDPIAAIGNTGMTSQPHLHFGVYSPDWIVSIPVIFNEYETLNRDGTRKQVKNSVPENRAIIVIK